MSPGDVAAGIDLLNGSRPSGPPDDSPGRDGTLLAVVSIPGTGTSLAIVGYAIATSPAPEKPGPEKPGPEKPGPEKPGQASPGPTAPDTGRSHGSGLRLDHEQRRVWTDGGEIELTFQEFELLAFLTAHPATVFTRANLVERVWRRDVSPTARPSRGTAAPWTCTSAGSGTSSARATASAWSPNTASATSSARWQRKPPEHSTTVVRAGIPRVAHWLVGVKACSGVGETPSRR